MKLRSDSGAPTTIGLEHSFQSLSGNQKEVDISRVFNDEQVAAIRAFSSFYRSVIEPVLAGTRGTAAADTVLDEVACGGSVEIAALRTTTGIDPGYLSRLLARMTAAGLVTVRRSGRDRRRRVVTITDRGKQEWKAARLRYAERVWAFFTGLEAHEQRRIIAAMQTIRESLQDPAPPRPR